MDYTQAIYQGGSRRLRRMRLASKGERGRDPYDGLRPWSAITHGLGAALALSLIHI